jgi:hypothetical protein
VRLPVARHVQRQERLTDLHRTCPSEDFPQKERFADVYRACPLLCTCNSSSDWLMSIVPTLLMDLLQLKRSAGAH